MNWWRTWRQRRAARANEQPTRASQSWRSQPDPAARAAGACVPHGISAEWEPSPHDLGLAGDPDTTWVEYHADTPVPTEADYEPEPWEIGLTTDRSMTWDGAYAADLVRNSPYGPVFKGEPDFERCVDWDEEQAAGRPGPPTPWHDYRTDNPNLTWDEYHALEAADEDAGLGHVLVYDDHGIQAGSVIAEGNRLVYRPTGEVLWPKPEQELRAEHQQPGRDEAETDCEAGF